MIRVTTVLVLALSLMSVYGCSNQTDFPGVVMSKAEKKRAAEARLLLGLAYQDQGNMQLAYLNLQRAMRYAPNDYQIYYAMARYYHASGDVALAKKKHEKALKLAPDVTTIATEYDALLCQVRQCL